MSSMPSDRRTFLARIGLLGAVVGTSVAVPGVANASSNVGRSIVPDLDLVANVLGELSRDTLNGLSVFVLPGPDAYSKAQGTPSSTPGALEADTTSFLIDALDNYVPFPDQIAQPVGAALANGLASSGVELPATGPLPIEIATLDEAFRTLLENDETLPLSFAIAALLNLLATQVNPLAVNGLFLSPFARLTYAEKARAFELLERPESNLVALLDAQFPAPLTSSVSGLLKFIGGALFEFPAFGSCSEFAVFDPRTKQLTGRPVGWDLTDYQPEGPVEGWGEFIGYYQGRQKISNA